MRPMLDDGSADHLPGLYVFYPVFPPDGHAQVAARARLGRGSHPCGMMAR